MKNEIGLNGTVTLLEVDNITGEKIEVVKKKNAFSGHRINTIINQAYGVDISEYMYALPSGRLCAITDNTSQYAGQIDMPLEPNASCDTKLWDSKNSNISQTGIQTTLITSFFSPTFPINQIYIADLYSISNNEVESVSNVIYLDTPYVVPEGKSVTIVWEITLSANTITL